MAESAGGEVDESSIRNIPGGARMIAARADISGEVVLAESRMGVAVSRAPAQLSRRGGDTDADERAGAGARRLCLRITCARA